MRCTRTASSWATGLLLAVLFAHAASAAPRILLIGDSWAAGVLGARAFDEVLEEAGLGTDLVYGESTAVSGSMARDWAQPQGRVMKNPFGDQPTGQDHIAAALAQHPTIDLVHIIIGGNDILEIIGYTQPSPDEWAARLQRIEDDIQALLTFLITQPQIRKVLLADYTYINPRHAQAVFGCLNGGGPAWSFGNASQREVTNRFLEAAAIKRRLADAHPQSHYLPHFGRLQHHFNTPPQAPAPGPPPRFDPFPGGDPQAPPPDEAFDPVQLGPCPPEGPAPGDGIHINKNAHKLLLETAVEHFYRDWLSEP